MADLGRLSGVTVRARSRIYESEPVGVREQPAFLNMAAEIETVLEPLELLAALKEIERALGRVPSERWGPRLIDIDIVLCEGLIIDSETLCVPHKEFRGRAFVLAPLADIAPDAMDPLTGKTVAQLAAAIDAAARVKRFGPVNC